MSLRSQIFVITPVKPKIDVEAARNLVRTSITNFIQNSNSDPGWVEDWDPTRDLVGDVDDNGKVLEQGGVWLFLNEIERLYSGNPEVGQDEDDKGAETMVPASTPNKINKYGLPVWEVVYGKYDSYTCYWIANCEWFNEEFQGLLRTIGITIFADQHYDTPAGLLV